MIQIARFITFILHPLVLITPAVFLIVYLSGQTYREAAFWTLVALGFTLVVVGYILLGMKRRIFSNFDVSNRKQRIYLFPVVILVGLLFLVTLTVFNGPLSLFFALIYFVIAVMILAFVNLRIKASIHVGSLTAVLVSGAYFFGGFFFPLLLLIPVMAWARVVEKRHTVIETVVGAVSGFLLAFLGIFIVQYVI